MRTSGGLHRESDTEAAVGTIMTYSTFLDLDGFCESLLSDLETVSYGDALRGLGLTRVSFWIQRGPDAAMAMWEGTDIETLFDRYAASSNPVLARRRGQLRVLAGPQEAENYWEASSHRLLSWGTGEQGSESEVRVHRGPGQVETYRELALDLQTDPSLLNILDRVRRRQGFTRVETWHRQANGEDLILTLVEGHHLKDAMAQMLAEDHHLDKRVMAVVRSSLGMSSVHPPTAKLLARWHA